MEPKEEKEFRQTLMECFSSDPELCEKYHVEAPASLEDCVERTNNDLLGEMENGYRFFRVEKSGDLVGYFGREHLLGSNILLGFFVMPRYRNKLNLKEFWRTIKEHFEGEDFYIGIYSKNTRAENFLVKQGCRLEGEDTNSKVYKSCH